MNKHVLNFMNKRLIKRFVTYDLSNNILTTNNVPCNICGQYPIRGEQIRWVRCDSVDRHSFGYFICRTCQHFFDNDIQSIGRTSDE